MAEQFSLVNYYWLVVWNMYFIFPYIDFHIFQSGGSTTNQITIMYADPLWIILIIWIENLYERKPWMMNEAMENGDDPPFETVGL